jgi:hypothetical protein
MKPNTTIVFCAFRYALGRSTYVVAEIVEYLADNWDEVPNYDKQIIKKEIRKAILNNKAGMLQDIRLWKEILDL